MQDKVTIGVIIVTLNAEKHLKKLLPPLLSSPLKPRVVLIDSSSTDKTASLAIEMGAEVITIPRKDFNHGTTREMARKLVDTEVVVFMTQDAYFVDGDALGELIKPIIEKKAALSYARQVPRKGSSLFESFPREFNYPALSHIRNLSTVSTWGIYTFFNSHSCAAYDSVALDTVGGFSKVLLGEDTIACAKLIHGGFSVAYVSESVVEHSHSFSLKEEFKRHFDIGHSRKEIEPLLVIAGPDQARGTLYASHLFKKVLKTPYLIPYTFCHLATKWLGYQIGKKCLKAPNFIKKRLSSQPYYFSN